MLPSKVRKCSHETGGNVRECGNVLENAGMFSRMRKCSRECGNVLENAEMFSLLRKCSHETGVSAEFAEMFSNVLVKPAERFP